MSGWRSVPSPAQSAPRNGSPSVAAWTVASQLLHVQVVRMPAADLVPDETR